MLVWQTALETPMHPRACSQCLQLRHKCHLAQVQDLAKPPALSTSMHCSMRGGPGALALAGPQQCAAPAQSSKATHQQTSSTNSIPRGCSQHSGWIQWWTQRLAGQGISTMQVSMAIHQRHYHQQHCSRTSHLPVLGPLRHRYGHGRPQANPEGTTTPTRPPPPHPSTPPHCKPCSSTSTLMHMTCPSHPPPVYQVVRTSRVIALGQGQCCLYLPLPSTSTGHPS